MVFNIDTQLGVDTLQLIKPTIKYLMKKLLHKFLQTPFLKAPLMERVNVKMLNYLELIKRLMK